MNKVIKAYNIADVGENDANIEMYGEVVQKRPIDWWTGEPVEGNYIVVDEFLADLDELKTKDNITVHINSVGGDLYGGVAIYNRMKELSANIVTINDGLAASAASIIFQAGDVRKVNSGSNVMVHQAAGFLWGYYNNAELSGVVKQLEAANKLAVNIYAEASGRTQREMKKLVDAETWFTGQEAVDAGLADEVIGDDVQISMSLTADKSQMIVNGVALSTRGMHNIPAGIPVMPANKAVSNAGTPVEDNKNQEKGEVFDMEIKNLEELKAAYPELVDQAVKMAHDEGRAEGVKAERERIQGIEDIQNAIADKELVKNAKYGDVAMSAEQLAFKAMQEQAKIGATMLEKMQSDAENSGAEGVGASPNKGPEGKGAEVVDEAQEVAEALKIFNQIKGVK